MNPMLAEVRVATHGRGTAMTDPSEPPAVEVLPMPGPACPVCGLKVGELADGLCQLCVMKGEVLSAIKAGDRPERSVVVYVVPDPEWVPLGRLGTHDYVRNVSALVSRELAGRVLPALQAEAEDRLPGTNRKARRAQAAHVRREARRAGL